MSDIAEEVEEQMEHWRILNTKTRNGDLTNVSTDLIIGHSLCEIAMQVGAPTIFSLSAHGNTPKAISSFRPHCNIIAITPDKQTARQMNLTWGVTPIVVEKDYADFMVKSGMEDAKKAGLVVSGTVAVIGGSDTYDYHNTSEFNSYKTIGGICIV